MTFAEWLRWTTTQPRMFTMEDAWIAAVEECAKIAYDMAKDASVGAEYCYEIERRIKSRLGGE